MTNADVPDDETFSFTMSSGGTPRGHLQDPSAVTLHLDPRLLGDAARGKEMFAGAVEQQHAALLTYATALQVADGDVTAPAVQDAATALHEALQFLPIAHTVYAGVGFPTARHDDAAKATTSSSPARGERGFGVHPDMLTAIHGDTSQRWELACEEDLPLAVEIAVATDPDANIRSAFLSGTTRSRTVVLLMEQRETDPDVLEQLAQQGFASPERKFPLPLADLVPRELDGLYALLGLDDQAIARAEARWAQAQDRNERISVGDALREIGVIA
ncbi:hypothetical protein DEJ17_05475 [Curtobacterium sp. MCSS17_011]|uniref:hypothetical protein n=1 Tax=Curtobacterium sp. MCSS17_011 TaxID=2175643 RepID=UPI000D95C199|nr:hypothetical protein [Curtobacterium sp. MCSS17_011]PYY60613.1 hypothetical protein DEJ17_05475 [Curtobacterium sp. MCSS17_011]